VNLVGHVAVALHRDPASTPPFLVGCMLPDLAAMARVRLTPADGHVGDGVQFHHRTDAAFHASEWFNRHNQALRDLLLDAEVDRGAARASAHAGLEMMLDGHLIGETQVERGVERAFAELATPSATSDAVTALAPDDVRGGWAERLNQISHSLDPQSYSSTRSVAERLHRMTRGRHRIELREVQVSIVARQLEAYRPRALHDVGSLLDDLSARV
jgi:hypothetical protein